MDIKLYHATKYAALAIEQMTCIAWASGSSEIQNQAAETAREYLAKAAMYFNEYDAKRTYKPKTETA